MHSFTLLGQDVSRNAALTNQEIITGHRGRLLLTEVLFRNPGIVLLLSIAAAYLGMKGSNSQGDLKSQ